jgi:hypothetical protein
VAARRRCRFARQASTIGDRSSDSTISARASELWIDDLTFYRHRSAMPGEDAATAADAAQM